MRLDYNSPEALTPVIEALIFASDDPLSAQELRALILGEEPTKTAIEVEPRPEETLEPGELDTAPDSEVQQAPVEGLSNVDEVGDIQPSAAPTKTPRKRKSPIELSVIHAAIELLNTSYNERLSAFRIVEIAGGYQFATRAEYADYVVRLYKEKSRRRLSGASLETLAIIAYKQPVSKLDVENIRGVNCDEVLKSLLEKNLITITGRAEAVGRPLLYGTTQDFLRHFGLPDIHDLPKPREIEELMKEESIRATTLEEAAHEFVTPPSESDPANADETVSLEEVIVEAIELEESNLDEEADASYEFAGIELDEEAMSKNSDEKSPMGQERGNG